MLRDQEKPLSGAPHGEEARSAVSNHEGRNPSFETAASRPPQDEVGARRFCVNSSSRRTQVPPRERRSSRRRFLSLATWKTPFSTRACTHKSDLSSMSALHSKADIGGALGHVRCGPTTDVVRLNRSPCPGAVV